MSERPRYDVAVVGGGLGGVAAALAASRLGASVVLVERGEWLGGQLTSQGVPPDEHPWIEGPHVARSYAGLRTAIREHYRRAYPLTARARRDPHLNPGLGLVSALCHEPRVAALVVEELLGPFLAAGRLSILRGHEVTDAAVDGDRCVGLTATSRAGRRHEVTATTYVDATETGDLLPLLGVEHVVGAESRDQTGELHAPATADPRDQQALSWCFAVSYHPGEAHTIERPPAYDRWRAATDPRWPGPRLGWKDVDPVTLRPRHRPMFLHDPAGEDHPGAKDWWHYRRILAASQLRAEPGVPAARDITLVNWPMTDYWDRPVLGVPPDERARAEQEARELARSFLYWLQTEAPRHDGGTGYPELRPRGDVLGTDDGLAREAYVRESLRIRAVTTVTEGDIGCEMRGPAGARKFADSVGIGWYRIDLHPSTGGRSYVDIDCHPFQIPLGALLPVRVRNLVAGAKNIGTTHISNGAYRLHPVEWSVGEAAGALGAVCARTGTEPHRVREHGLEDYQRVLAGTLGVPLAWPEEISSPTIRGASCTST